MDKSWFLRKLQYDRFSQITNNSCDKDWKYVLNLVRVHFRFYEPGFPVFQRNELQAVSCSGSVLLCEGPDWAALVSLWLTRQVLSFHQNSTSADGSDCASGGASTFMLEKTSFNTSKYKIAVWQEQECCSSSLHQIIEEVPPSHSVIFPHLV